MRLEHPLRNPSGSLLNQLHSSCTHMPYHTYAICTHVHNAGRRIWQICRPLCAEETTSDTQRGLEDRRGHGPPSPLPTKTREQGPTRKFSTLTTSTIQPKNSLCFVLCTTPWQAEIIIRWKEGRNITEGCPEVVNVNKRLSSGMGEMGFHCVTGWPVPHVGNAYRSAGIQ
jgi:hypothetical protein